MVLSGFRVFLFSQSSSLLGEQSCSQSRSLAGMFQGRTACIVRAKFDSNIGPPKNLAQSSVGR